MDNPEYRYNDCIELINLNLMTPTDITTNVSICLPRFAWRVARAYLATLAKQKWSYAIDFKINGYDGPTDEQFDIIEALIDDALAADIEQCGGDDSMYFYGQIILMATDFLPIGFYPCDGDNYDPDEYPEAFDAIGYTWGQIGDNFKVPDLRGKFPMNAKNTYPFGDEGGEDFHALTINELPSHSHSQTAATSLSGANRKVLSDGTAVGDQITTSNTGSVGSGFAHNNLPPYIAMTYGIYLGGD